MSVSARSVTTVMALALTLALALPSARSASAETGDGRPFLLTLQGQAVVVSYSPGGLDRAYHVQRRLELLTADAARWTGESLRLRVFVLGRAEWGEVGVGLPYGLPGRLPGNVLAVPAAGDEGTVALWTRLRGAPPPPLGGRPLTGTPEEASSLALADLLVEVEGARALLSLAGFRGETVWVHQVMVHLLTLAAFERYESARLSEIGEFFAALGRGIDRTPSLDDYTEGLDLATLLWFESRFHEGARRVLASDRKNEAKKVLAMARKNGGVLTRADLLGRYPALRGWLEEAFAPSGN